MKTGLLILKRDVLQLWRYGLAGLNAIVFFVLAVSLFPLSIGPDPALLARIAGGGVWVAALLSSFLSLEQFFARDEADGSLDLFLSSPVSTLVLVSAKAAAHWIATALPLIIAAPLAALALYLPLDQVGRMVLALVLGTPALSLLGGVGAALTLGLRQTGVLLSLLVLPFYVPVLIFGAGAIEPALGGEAASGALQLLAAISLIALVAAPPAMAAALRIAQE